MLYIAGPGHGGPALNANSYLEGTYSAVHPEVTQDAAGIRQFFREFSTPGGVPSHCGPHLPNSIHEGGELGYALLHAFGAAFDNPELIVACVIGDGEAETAALEGSWKWNRFLNPVRDGAVLPILHLNGYKISGPTVEARTRDEELTKLYAGHGYKPYFVEGDDPRPCTSNAPPFSIPVCGNSRDSSRGPHERQCCAHRRRPGPRLAHDHSSLAKGLDGPQGS